MDPTTEKPEANGARLPRDAGNWSKPVARLQTAGVPEGAINLNVDGRRLAGPMQGFGKLWQKTYRMTLPAERVSAKDLVSEWKAHFGEFWPKGAYFYGPLTSLNPGDVAVLNLKAGAGVKLSTGVFVMYADETSFTFMDAEGHQFSAWITFSAEDTPDGTLVQIQPLLRTSDPLYELAWPVMSRMEDRFWDKTMHNLAAHFGLVEGITVSRQVVCVDKKRQWRNWRNIRHNAGIRSFVYALGAPFRVAAKPFRRRAKASA